MHTLSLKNPPLTTRLARFIIKHKWVTLCLLFGMYQFSGGIIIYAKAELAQLLIGNAWHKKLTTGTTHKPWPWADTHPVAELIIDDKSWYILAGASGRNLAFAPTHVSATPLPGEAGNSVIVGHRDTQFNPLKSLELGDLIEVKTQQKRQQFKITMLRIAHQSQTGFIDMGRELSEFTSDTPSLTLITCYPLDSMIPNPTLRYVVRGVAI